MKNGMKQSRPAIHSLTGLRFLAAISVAIAHGSSMLLTYSNDGLKQYVNVLSTVAGLGMPLFFVLSGFVIHYNYFELISVGRRFGLFLWARFARLYPLFIFFLFIDFLTTGTRFVVIDGNVDDLFRSIRALPFFLIFTQSWFYKIYSSNSVIYQLGFVMPLTWSISTEWFFYLAYIPLSFALRKIVARQYSLIATVLIAWIALFWFASMYSFDKMLYLDEWAISRFGPMAGLSAGHQDSFVRWALYFSPFARIGEFISGCLVCALYVRLQSVSVSDREKTYGRITTYASLLLVPVFIYLMYLCDAVVAFRKVSNNIGLTPVLVVLIFCVSRYDTWISRLLSTPTFVRLGEISYSIYLSHILVFLYIMKASAFPLIPYQPGFVVWGFTRFIAALLLVVIISLGLYQLVEDPARRVLRGFWGSETGPKWPVFACTMAPLLAAAGILCVLYSFESKDSIHIVEATYGMNCLGKKSPLAANTVAKGNKTRQLADSCEGRGLVRYTVNAALLGDPAPGLGKDFYISWRCNDDPQTYELYIEPEANGKAFSIDCTNGSPTSSN